MNTYFNRYILLCDEVDECKKFSFYFINLQKLFYLVYSTLNIISIGNISTPFAKGLVSLTLILTRFAVKSNDNFQETFPTERVDPNITLEVHVLALTMSFCDWVLFR